jgi:ATP-dependent helicase/nuclease subunit B
MAVLLTRRYTLPLERVEETVFARLREGDVSSTIYVVPTKRKLRDLQRECLKAIPSRIAPSLNLFTLETLASALAALHAPPRFVVSGPTLAVLMQNALKRSANRLGYFRPRGPHAWLPKGTFQKIVDVITSLKESGIYPAAMYDEVEGSSGSDRSKVSDILAIYEEFENVMGETCIDVPGILKELNDRWEPLKSALLFSRRFPGVRDLLISGFDEFSDPELTMIGNLSSLESLRTAVQFDYHTGNEPLFGHLHENYLKLIEMGFEPKKPPRRKRSSFHQHIAATLFNDPAPESRIQADDHVTILHAGNRQEEVEVIAKLIKHLVLQEHGPDPDRICIAMYHPQMYTPLLREAFERFGIPANITDRFALDQSPLVVSILALLAVQQNNFQLRDVMKALSSPFFRIESPAGRVDAGNLYSIAVRLKIKGGLGSWNARIRAQMKRIEADSLRTDDPEESALLERERRALMRAQTDLETLGHLLDRFSEALTPTRFRDRLVALLEELHTLEQLLEPGPETLGMDTLEKDARAYQQFLAFLDQLVVMIGMQGRSDVKEPIQFYLDQLRTALAHVRYNIRQRYGEGVLVTSFEETRDLHFDIMIVAGMVDGEFPPLYQPEVFLTPSRRERIERYHLTEQRYLFYQAITNHVTHLYLTVPAADGEVELVPSTFLDALRESATVEEFHDHRPHWLTDTLYSEDELLLRAGRFPLKPIAVQNAEVASGGRIGRTMAHIHKAQEVERLRAGNVRSEYNGSIPLEAGPATDRLRKRVYSVTQLESYGRCPFQFFAQRILRLNAVSEPEEGLTPLERGSFIHEVLFEFYTGRRNRGAHAIAACDQAEFDAAVKEITELAGTKLDAIEVPDVLWQVEREVVTGSPERRSMFEDFLRMEREQPEVLLPSFFEAGFGSGGKKLQSMDPLLRHPDPVLASEVSLRGKVDRIDMGEGKFTIIDYKTGKRIPSLSDIRQGLSLQLPVYLYAVGLILKEFTGSPVEGVGGFYVGFRPEVRKRSGLVNKEHAGTSFKAARGGIVVPSEAELNTVIAAAIRFVNEYVDGISTGRFPVSPKEPQSTCSYCEFKPACRIQSRSVLTEREDE